MRNLKDPPVGNRRPRKDIGSVFHGPRLGRAPRIKERPRRECSQSQMSKIEHRQPLVLQHNATLRLLFRTYRRSLTMTRVRLMAPAENIYHHQGILMKIGHPLRFTLALTAAISFIPQAFAVPSYSRQTGLPCASCHYAPPELNAFGRQFKLEGYTFTTKAQVTDDKKDHNAVLQLLESFPLSVVFDTSFTATKSPQPGTQNGNFQFPQAASLFLAGAWTKNIGSFVQVTYDSQGDHFSWDNTDIRYANHDRTLFGKPLTYGITLNNNPSVEDLWNTTPAWGYPYVGSNVAPGPTAAAVINGTLAQDVAGVGGYTMWNQHWYLAGTIYRSEHIGGAQPNSGAGFSYNIRGVAPYWRAAYQTSSNNNYLEIGTYGMHVKSTPNAVTGLMDSYTDWGTDFEYDRTIPQFKNDVVSVRGTYIRENSTLLATFAEGGAAQTSHH